MSKVQKWTDDRVEALVAAVDGESPVSNDTVNEVATILETTSRSVAAKLRNLGIEVQSSAKSKTSAFTDAQADELGDFLEINEGKYTYSELAGLVLGGEFSPKQIQGKILSMELTGSVKATPQKETVKSFSDDEEATVLSMIRAGDFIEDIATAVNKTVASVRGKALSLSRVHDDISIPKQRDYVNKGKTDPLVALGDSIPEMTVEAIAEAIDKSVRGVKTMLTHRGLDAKNHKGSVRKAKNETKAA